MHHLNYASKLLFMRHRHFKISNTFLIMHHTITRALARALGIRTCDRRYLHTYSTRCHIQKVPRLPKWPLLQLTTSTYIGSSAAYVVTMYTSGSGTRPLAKSWVLLASGTTHTIATLSTRARFLGGSALAVQRIGKGASLGELWKKLVIFPSFAHAMATIVDFVTSLNYASRFRVILRHEEFLFMRHPSKIIIFRATHN